MAGDPSIVDRFFRPLTPEQRAELGAQFEAEAAQAMARIRTERRVRFEVPLESPLQGWPSGRGAL